MFANDTGNVVSENELKEKVSLLAKIEEPLDIVFWGFSFDSFHMDLLEKIPEIQTLEFYMCHFDDCKLSAINTSEHFFTLVLYLTRLGFARFQTSGILGS